MRSAGETTKAGPSRSRILLLVVAALLFGGAAVLLAGTAFADAPRVLGGGAPGDRPEFRVLSKDAGGLTLEVALPTVVLEDVALAGQTFQALTIPGGEAAGDPGEPMLPTFTRFVLIPDRAGVQVTAVPEDEEEVSGIRLLPMQSEDDTAFRLDAAAYARDGFGDRAPAVASPPGILRGMRVISLTLAPVRYNPAQGKVRIARRMRVQVTFAGEDPTNAVSRPPRSLPPTFDRLCRQLVVNYPAEGERAPVENGSYLVICPNDPEVVSRLQPLLEWRQREGYTVHLATTAETGTSSGSIKNYIAAAYTLWNPPPEFVVLAGDASGGYVIPTWNVNGGEGDNQYTQLDGNDLISDVHIGRLSFNTLTELETIVAKSVNYESNPNLTDPSWYTRACLVGDPNGSGISCIMVMQWIKTRLREIGYAQIDTVFSGNFVSQMQTDLNRGDTIFAYRGYYGFSGWSNSYTNALTNFNKLHFAVISTCGTGSFASETSNSEAFLRAGTAGTPKAAVGATGTATLSTHTRYNNTFEMGLMQGLLYEDLWEMGAAFTRGKTELALNYAQADLNQATNFCTWNNLMGDPAVRIFTAVPTPLTVTYPATVALGANSVAVMVREQLGEPCAGAQVCLWKGTETFVVRTTEADGSCELPVNLATAGTMKLTVTKHNRVPRLADITVAQQTSYVGFQAAAVDDDNSGGSQGNSDGQINPGETIQLRVQLKNFGTSQANSVTGVLTTEDPYLTIADGSDAYGNIAPGASAWSQGTYLFTVSQACPHDHALLFGLDVTSGSNTWHSVISLPAVAPDLSATAVLLYDIINGQLDPGETLQLAVRLRNEGGQAASGVTAKLTSESPWVTVTDSLGSYGNIAIGAAVENSGDRFAVSADPGTYPGHVAVFRVVTSMNGGAVDTTYASVTVGTRTSDDPTGPDLYGYYAFDNTDAGYSDCPVYSWVEIDPNQGGDGVQVPLGDMGDQQDRSSSLDLPFSFRFYGEDFTRATICSNGWLSLGDTYLTLYRNMTIPGAGAPPNLVAVFWDELREWDSGHVYQKYDSANHRWIVEWSRLVNGYNGSSEETFEAILYDPAFTSTPTGDGVILMQYATVNNVDPVDGYATVGIQNETHSDGLLYTYYNLYPGGASPLAAGRAIRFVPAAAVPQGILQGVVRNGSHNNDPLPGAVVEILGTSRTFVSGEDGGYTGGAPEGTYSVTCSREGFAADTVGNVHLISGQAVNLDFALADNGGPGISDVTRLISTPDTAGPYEVSATVEDPSEVGTVTLLYRVGGGAWNETPMTGGPSVFTGSIPGMNAGATVDYYVRATDSIDNVATDPANAPESFYTFRITSIFYSTDCEDPGDPNWLLGMEGDGATAGLWNRVVPVGSVRDGQSVHPETDHTPDPGTMCFLTGNGPSYADGDVDGGCTTLRSPIFDLSSADQAYLSYYRWYAMLGAFPNDSLHIDVSSDGGASWVSLELLTSMENTWTKVTKDLGQSITLTDQVCFRVKACDFNQTTTVVAALDDVAVEVFVPDLTGAPEPEPVGPATFDLAGAQPNPFTGRTAVHFSLASAGKAQVSVYDVQGRCVRRLLDGRASAGPHTLVWDGRDDTGKAVPSGLYFTRLEADGRQATGRLIRVE